MKRMSVDRSLPLATVFGLLVEYLVYQFLLSDWHLALVIATIYAGAAYFYFAFDIALFGSHVEFKARSDKIGYAIGLFGVSVSPLALGAYNGSQESAVFGIVVWIIGMIAFSFWRRQLHIVKPLCEVDSAFHQS